MDERVSGLLTRLNGQLDVWIEKQIFDNEFLIAGIATVLMSAGVYLLRNVPRRLWAFIVRTTTVEMTINNDVEAFAWLMWYIDKHRVDWLQRTYQIGTNNVNGPTIGIPTEQEGSSRNTNYVNCNWLIGPGMGFSLFFHRRRPVIVNIRREDTDSHTVKMLMHLRFIGRGSIPARALISELHDQANKNQLETVSVYAYRAAYGWSMVTRKPKRPMTSIFMVPGVKESIVDHARWFFENQQWYIDRGLPYHTGIMLTGEPGCGKSSLIHALASYFKKEINILNLNTVTDATVMSALQFLDDQRGILVIEDIDTFSMTKVRPVVSDEMENDVSTTNEAKEEKINNAVSLSSLLNILDGLLSPHGLLTIATTNHPEKLDPALKRAGRFDLSIELSPLFGQAFVDMAVAFYGESWREAFDLAAGKPSFKPITGADAQALFRQHQPDEALHLIETRSKVAA